MKTTKVHGNRKVDPEKVRKLIEGRTLQEVADMVGVCRQRISQIVGPTGRSRARRPVKTMRLKENRAKIEKMFRAGATVADVLNKFEVGEQVLYRAGMAKFSIVMPQADKHGTRSCYMNRSCRCSECKAANCEYVKMFRKKRKATQ